MSFYYGSQQSGLHSQHPHNSSGRSRRQARASGSQHNNHHHHHHNHNHHHHSNNNNKQQIRAMRLQKEAEESALEKTFRRDFEAARSFDIEDDEIFCPFNLLTDDDLQSISSSGSDRSSLSSGSPEQSPLQPQVHATSAYLLPPTTASFTPAYQQPAASVSQTKLHQPLAQRSRNAAIAIVDPSTRAVASPPPSVSVSPARQMQQQQFMAGRRW